MSLISIGLPLGNIGDLITPSSTQIYPLGYTVSFKDTATTAIKRYMYVKSHTTLTALQPYLVLQTGTAGAEWVTAAPIAGVNNLVCVAPVAFTASYFGFVQIEGYCNAIADGVVPATGWAALPTAATGFLAASTDVAAPDATGACCAQCIVASTGSTSTAGYFHLGGFRIVTT